MKNQIGSINENDYAMASQIADRLNQTPAQVLNSFNAFLNDMLDEEDYS